MCGGSRDQQSHARAALSQHGGRLPRAHPHHAYRSDAQDHVPTAEPPILDERTNVYLDYISRYLSRVLEIINHVKNYILHILHRIFYNLRGTVTFQQHYLFNYLHLNGRRNGSHT